MVKKTRIRKHTAQKERLSKLKKDYNTLRRLMLILAIMIRKIYDNTYMKNLHTIRNE